MVEPSEVTDMDLYLMQHGQATTETEDPERPLTDAGRAAVQRVGHMPFLGRLASLLVVGDKQAQVVGFQMGGLVKLEPKVDRDGFSVAWGASARPRLTCTKDWTAPCITEKVPR
jgi:phosphohistidine phosphatase SixA